MIMNACTGCTVVRLDNHDTHTHHTTIIGDLKQGSVLLCLVVHVLARVHIHSFIIIIYYNNILSSSFTHTFFVVYKHNNTTL